VGLHPGFSQTSSHFGLGHSGLWHFQSQFGSSQTASQIGLGDFLCHEKIVRRSNQKFAKNVIRKKNYLAMGHAMWRLANCHTFWTIFRLASFVWTHDLTIWLFTFHVTDRIFGLLA
jgi:hypothetical protein